MKTVHHYRGAGSASGYRRARAATGTAAIAFALLVAGCARHDIFSDTTSAPIENAADSRNAAPERNVTVAAAKTREYEIPLDSGAEVAAYGRGPYICSPSGFGQKSRCVPRTSFN